MQDRAHNVGELFSNAPIMRLCIIEGEIEVGESKLVWLCGRVLRSLGNSRCRGALGLPLYDHTHLLIISNTAQKQ